MTGIRRTAPLLLAAACALHRPAPLASPSPTPEGPPRPARADAERRTAYAEEPPAPRSAFELRALGEVLRALRAAGASARPSQALHRAAGELATAAARGDPAPLSRQALQRALQAAAAFDPAPTAHLASGSQDEALSALLTRLAPAGVTHFGVAAAEGGGAQHVVLLLSRRRARLDPFPAAVEPGVELRLSGELLGLLHPRVFVTDPAGVGTELSVEGGLAFTSRVRFPSPGTYSLEVMGTGASGPEVAAILKVTAGPDGISREPEPPPSKDPVSLEEAEASVAEASNRLRKAHGLPALPPSAELGAVARRHSERMLEAGRVAHVLPGSPELAERLLAARIPFRLALENVARGETALAAHAATVESPAHRRNLLSEAVTRLGVGLARGTLPTGERIVYLTTLLVEPLAAAEADRLTPDARVREALWQERARRALPPLTNDLQLEALAQAAAAKLRAEDGGETSELAEAALRMGRGLAAADAFIAGAPAEALRSRNLSDRRFRRVGVGVVTGDSRRFGPGRLYIAVVYSD